MRALNQSMVTIGHAGEAGTGSVLELPSARAQQQEYAQARVRRENPTNMRATHLCAQPNVQSNISRAWVKYTTKLEMIAELL